MDIHMAPLSDGLWPGAAETQASVAEVRGQREAKPPRASALFIGTMDAGALLIGVFFLTAALGSAVPTLTLGGWGHLGDCFSGRSSVARAWL